MSEERRSVAIAAVLVAATLGWRLLTFTGFTNDHYAHLALAQQMLLLGEWPVRDFADPGWPLTYLISAAAWRLAGDAMWVEWAVTATAFALAAGLTFLAARRLSASAAIAVLVTAFEVLIYPRTYAYPKLLPYAAFAWIIVAGGGSPSRRRLIALGTLIAVAFLLRHDHGVWIGLATIVYVGVANRAEGLGAAMRGAVIVGVAAAAVLLPWLLFLAASGGIVAYFDTALEFARGEANASNLRAWPTFRVAADLPQNADAWLFWLFWGLPIAAAAIGIRRWARGHERWRGELAAVGSLAVLAVCVNAGFLRDILRTRFADAVVPAALLGAWLLGLCWCGRWRHRAAQHVVRAVAAIAVVISAIAVGAIAEVPERFERAGILRGPVSVAEQSARVSRLLNQPHRQDVSPPSRVAGALVPFFAYLDRCTSPRERLIVTGEFPDVIVLSGRGFAGDGVVFGAWYSSATHQDRTLERLRGQPALFTLLLDEPGFRERFRDIARYVDQEYIPFADVRDDGVHVPILVHRARTPVRTDAATGWPCFH